LTPYELKCKNEKEMRNFVYTTPVIVAYDKAGRHTPRDIEEAVHLWRKYKIGPTPPEAALKKYPEKEGSGVSPSSAISVPDSPLYDGASFASYDDRFPTEPERAIYSEEQEDNQEDD
jgi:hypothetical protein